MGVMNLYNLESVENLQQDEWSLTAPTFGQDGQLTVVGWIGQRGRYKYYIVKCQKCSQDPELFGEGYFRTVKPSLVNMGKIPCGCSKSPNWTRDQFYTLCKRKAALIGHNFIDFVDPWKGQKTKVIMLCSKHGEWESTSIDGLLTSGNGCPACKAVSFGIRKTKPDATMIASFMVTACYHPDTVFWRSSKPNIMGSKPYWFVYCPECGETYESMASHLQMGKRGCGCSRHRQKEAYINWLLGDSGKVVAIKFGISIRTESRVQNQDRLCSFRVVNYLVYKFPSVFSCKRAEQECKQKLVCNFLSKEEMPDGYTETTDISNLFKIIEIYRSFGGIEDYYRS